MRQRTSFVIYDAYWLQDDELQKSESNIYSFTLNLIDSSSGQLVWIQPIVN